MNRFASVSRLPEFERDFKALSRRSRTLDEDFRTFQTYQVAAFHKLGQDNGGIVRISRLGFAMPHLYKARKFACRALPGKGAKTGLRVIYAYFPEEDHLVFVEIYFKADQPHEDRARILRHFGKA